MWYAEPCCRSCASNSSRLQAAAVTVRSPCRPSPPRCRGDRARRARSDPRPGSGLVLLMWIKILRVARRQPLEPLEHAARAALRQMADIARALLRHPEADHFIVGPKSAVDQHARGRLHGLPKPIVDGAETRRVHRRPAGGLVLDHERHVVARNRGLAIRRIRRGFARHGQRAPLHVHHRIDGEGLPRSIRRRSMPQKWPRTRKIGLPSVRSA